MFPKDNDLCYRNYCFLISKVLETIVNYVLKFLLRTLNYNN